MKIRVELTEIRIGDKMTMADGTIETVSEIIISKTGASITFKFESGDYTAPWRIKTKYDNRQNIIR